MMLLLAIIMVIVAFAGAASSPSPRNVNQLSQWANQQGVVMHDSLQWKKAAAAANDGGESKDADDDENNNDDDNIGLELKGSVPPGTVLLKVPRSIVFDAQCIRKEFEDENPDGRVQKALDKLAQSGFDQHRDGFFIFCKVLRCCQEGETSLWSPYIQSLPRHFIEFSNTEKNCLPFYAKYVADYQEDKFKAFSDAAVESGLVESVVSSDDDNNDDDDFNQARWAFCAISSRFWKTPLTEAGTAEIMKGNAPPGATADATSELVPVGDMFNHREPPNVAITHEGDFVNFVYKGDDHGNVDVDGDDITAAADTTKDLYITYGQPSNPHRFLGIFGFVPAVNDMPNVWSHVIYTDNPFTDDVEYMVFRAEDGHVPKKVWDAVLYALLEPKHPPNEPPEFTDEQHTKYRTHTADVLQGHVTRQLEELSALREKIKMIEAIGSSSYSDNTNNIPLIRQHNEFLTDVFTKEQKQVQDELNE